MQYDIYEKNHIRYVSQFDNYGYQLLQ